MEYLCGVGGGRGGEYVSGAGDGGGREKVAPVQDHGVEQPAGVRGGEALEEEGQEEDTEGAAELGANRPEVAWSQPKGGLQFFRDQTRRDGRAKPSGQR